MADTKSSHSTPASLSPAALQAARPLSPHLQVYAWSWTMAMSIAHRVTGAALYFGTLILAAWLIALICGPVVYDQFKAVATSIFGRFVLFGYTWALMHHMLGGLRHFIWDVGAGYSDVMRRGLAIAGLIGSVCLTAAIWVVAYSLR